LPFPLSLCFFFVLARTICRSEQINHLCFFLFNSFVCVGEMGLDDTNALKAKRNCQSKKQSKKSENHKKKKNNSKGKEEEEEDEEEEEERVASGCWLNFRFMF